VGRSVVAAGISFLLSVGAVTAIEHSAGKSLTCWVWEECPVQSSNDEDGGSSDTSTLPSIFGGGPSVGSDAAAVGVRPALRNSQPPLWMLLSRLLPRKRLGKKQQARKAPVLGQVISGRTRITTTPKKSTGNRALLLLQLRKKPSGEKPRMAALNMGCLGCLGPPEGDALSGTYRVLFFAERRGSSE